MGSMCKSNHTKFHPAKALNESRIQFCVLLQGYCQILQNTDGIQQGTVLEQDSNTLQGGVHRNFILEIEFLTNKFDHTLCGCHQSQNTFKQGRLAAAAPTQNNRYLILKKIQINVIQDGSLAKTGKQPLDLDDRYWGRLRPCISN